MKLKLLLTTHRYLLQSHSKGRAFFRWTLTSFRFFILVCSVSIWSKRQSYLAKHRPGLLINRLVWLWVKQCSVGIFLVCYLMVNVELVVLPGLQRLIKSCVTLHCGIRQNGTSKIEPKQQAQTVCSTFYYSRLCKKLCVVKPWFNHTLHTGILYLHTNVVLKKEARLILSLSFY